MIEYYSMIRFTQGTFSKIIQRSKPFQLMSKKKVDRLFIVITIRRENLNCSFNSLELEHVHFSCLPKIKKNRQRKKMMCLLSLADIFRWIQRLSFCFRIEQNIFFFLQNRIEQNRIVYLMSKTQEVLAQSSEPEAHVKNVRRTKNTKQDQMRVIYI